MTDLPEGIKDIMQSINELQSDNTTPKNVKEKLQNVVNILNNGDEGSIKVSKALEKLEEIMDDANLQSYVRTHIWNIASMLEAI